MTKLPIFLNARQFSEKTPAEFAKIPQILDKSTALQSEFR